MSAPYSDDKRTKAIAAVERGERQSDVCRMMKLSRNTLELWRKRQEQTGDYQAIANFQTGCRHKITDWQRCGAFVKEHGDKTQAQMAQLWGENVTQLGTLVMPYKSLDSVVKKDLRVARTR